MAHESGRKRSRWDNDVEEEASETKRNKGKYEEEAYNEDRVRKALELKQKIEARLQRIKTGKKEQEREDLGIVLEKEKDVEEVKSKTLSVEDDALKRYVDRGTERKPRPTFAFVEAGRFQRQAHNERLKAKYGEEVAKKMRKREMKAFKFGSRSSKSTEGEMREVSPEVEWWDVPLLRNGTYEDVAEGKCDIAEEKITIYIEHPVPIEPLAEAPPPPPQPLKLTKQELKKLRTQRRQAREKEKQAMIAQGLLEPPKPKVKISNLMRVLGEEASMDPTAIEREVRRQMEERQQAHEDRNLARKLTPAEKREKKIKKMFDTVTENETHVAIFRLGRLDNPQHRFKVDVNARENRFTGICLITTSMVLVIVEGVPKAIKRYSKLLLHRIDWNADIDNGTTNALHEKTPNKCECIWQGIVQKPSFRKFRLEDCELEGLAKRILANAGVEHYWDMAKNAPSM